jgi:hypothetical protein
MAARFSVVLSFVALLAVLGTSAAVHAQQLARFHVLSFTLTTDTPHPRIEQPFNVTLTIRLRESVSGELGNVILPTFTGAEELGDERVLSSGSGGTTYRETLRLVAHARGPLTIGSAYLDAIDARDGKPKRFISNDLHLQVDGGPLFDVWGPLRAIGRALVELLLLAAAIFVVVSMFRRRPAPKVEVPAAVPPPVQPIAPPSPEDVLRQRIEELRLRRDRRSVLHVRAALWATIGAHDGETLADVLRRPVTHDPRTRSLLVRVERAAFIEDARLANAIDDVLDERESHIA